jgi:hypothetical protein
MAIVTTHLVSGRVPVVAPTSVTSDRYTYLGLNQAEPNLGFSGNGNVLTTDIYGNRLWSKDLSLNTIALTGNLLISNVVNSRSTTTGALVVNGGAGIGGNLYVGGNIGSGTWLGSTIGVLYGGTGATTPTGALTNLLPSGAQTGYVLTTSGTGSYFWASQNSINSTVGQTITTLRQSNTATQGQTVFTLVNGISYIPGAGQLDIYINGVRQFPTEYTETSNVVYTLNSGVGAGDVVFAEINASQSFNNYANLVYASNIGNIAAVGLTVQSAINALEINKATLANPVFTGVVTAPTANLTSGQNSIAVNNGGALTVAGGAAIAKDVWIGGNLYVANIYSQTTNIISINDPLLYLQTSNVYPYNYDIGFYSHFIGGPANIYAHSGLVRDYTDNTWKFFSNVAEPSAGLVTFDSNTIYDNIKAGNLILAAGAGSGGYATVGALNSSGNILAQGGVFNSLTVNGTSSVSGDILPSANVTYNLGSPTLRFKTGYFSASTIDLGGNQISVNAVNGFTFTIGGSSTPIVLAGNGLVSGTSLSTAGNLNVGGTTFLGGGGPTVFTTYNLDPSQATGNIATYWANGRTIMGSNRSGGQGEFDIIAHRDGGSSGGFSVYDWSTANVTLANILMNINYSTGMTVSGNVIPNTSNTYTLGTSTNWWTKTWSQSVNALYADLAEMYSSDQAYSPGTVVVFGGEEEVTISTVSHDSAVAGVVSTDPAYLMNSTLSGVAVALQGRVACQVQGPINKGELVVTSNISGVAQRLDPALWKPGCAIGKSLESIKTNQIVTIEVVVGRN